MQILADLHIHSKYSRAVSQQMELETMAEWGEKKGIDLLATADWTHPLWFKEIEGQLEEDGEGIFKLKSGKSKTRFVLSTEISNIYSQGGKGRRVHTVFMAPNLETAEKINNELKRRGGNLLSDGRPILGLSVEEMCEVVWSVDEEVIVVPAHIWTPWFSMFGSKSGFDSVKDCFGKYESRIEAIETGLSSDPAMNWRIEELKERAIVSFSDAHSPKKIGREATVLEVKEKQMSFEALRQGLTKMGGDKAKISYTIEFYPEEGKYHYTGHRKCGVCQSPEETKEKGTGCHVCGRALTVGVMHRVEELAKGRGEIKPVKKASQAGVVGYYHPTDKLRPPYVMLVPLQEILAEAMGMGTASQKVQMMYEQLVAKLGGEFGVLLKSSLEEIKGVGGERVAEAVNKVRKGEIVVKPGYDGVFGVVKIWPAEGEAKEGGSASEQQSLF